MKPQESAKLYDHHWDRFAGPYTFYLGRDRKVSQVLMQTFTGEVRKGLRAW